LLVAHQHYSTVLYHYYNYYSYLLLFSMRFSTILPVALAAAPLAVSATGGRFGFALGSRHTGKPTIELCRVVLDTDASLDGTCKSTSDYEADFETLKSKTTIVRTYSVVDGAISNTPCQVASAILPAAANKGFQVILGVW
jgi:glucan 1,3-beta-glucosidase